MEPFTIDVSSIHKLQSAQIYTENKPLSLNNNPETVSSPPYPLSESKPTFFTQLQRSFKIEDPTPEALPLAGAQLQGLASVPRALDIKFLNNIPASPTTGPAPMTLNLKS